MTFGQKVRDARKKLGLSQAALADKIGRSRRTVVDWEQDRTLPRTRKIYGDLADALGVPIGWLLTDEADFVIRSEEQFGYRGRRDAEQLVAELTGLFAGGEMAEEDMDAMMLAVQQAYVDAKKKNRKYTPKKYLSDEQKSDR